MSGHKITFPDEPEIVLHEDVQSGETVEGHNIIPVEVEFKDVIIKTGRRMI